MPPQSYRYYRLDLAGHLHDGEWFEAASDADAIAQIQVQHPDSRCEIWSGTRLVAKLYGKHFDPDHAGLQKSVGERLSALALRRSGGRADA